MCGIPGGKKDRQARNLAERKPKVHVQKIHPSHRMNKAANECLDCNQRSAQLAEHCTSVQVPG